MTDELTPKFELTNDDRQSLAEMVQSKAWDILINKVWNVQAEFMREMCCRVIQDFRFAQGNYQGFCFAKELAEQKAKPEVEMPRIHVPSEADLVSRKGWKYY